MKPNKSLWFIMIAFLVVSCTTVFDRDGRRSDRRDGDSRSGRWQLLGEKEVDFSNDRDRINVGRNDGPFRELRIEVRDAPIEIREMVVTFGDGQKFRPQINARLAEGKGSHVIDLPGNRRSIDGVEFVYRSIDRRQGKSRVLLHAR